jgi:dethiobiotin synthetase
VKGIFVTSTGTGCGKTWLARGLARRALRAGHRVVALKPIETGVERVPEDAVALARACGRPELVDVPGFVRRRAPVSPRAAELAGEGAIDLAALVEATRRVLVDADVGIVEGAGGALTPVSRGTSILDLAVRLELPVLLVAPDALGTISHTLTAVEACRRRQLEVWAVALLAGRTADPSTTHNQLIIQEESGVQVRRLSQSEDDDDALADGCGPVAGWMVQP